MQGSDQSLFVTVIADRLARGGNAAIESSLRDRPPLPDYVYEFLSPDSPVVVANEVDKEINDLSFDVHDAAAAPQLAAYLINLNIGEAKGQGSASAAMGEPSPCDGWKFCFNI